MNALQTAEALGVSPAEAGAYIQGCDEVVESGQYVATRKGPTVHIAVKMKGLGGRKLLKDCRETLRGWFDKEDTLFAPVKFGNHKAIRIAEALGFHRYSTTDVHVWLVQTKEKFHGH